MNDGTEASFYLDVENQQVTFQLHSYRLLSFSNREQFACRQEELDVDVELLNWEDCAQNLVSRVDKTWRQVSSQKYRSILDLLGKKADHSVLRLLQISQQHIESQLAPWQTSIFGEPMVTSNKNQDVPQPVTKKTLHSHLSEDRVRHERELWKAEYLFCRGFSHVFTF